ncbi:MAG: hypothetical protein AVO33_06150 [delta proteobacterium ML8_F1]|nr:MAG: hypothetical protein AVO33_06150 [delta proteobacterium ML8_F1]
MQGKAVEAGLRESVDRWVASRHFQGFSHLHKGIKWTRDINRNLMDVIMAFSLRAGRMRFWRRAVPGMGEGCQV